MQKFYSQFQRKIGNKHNCLPNSFQVSIIIMWQDECVQASPCRQHNVECYVLLLTRRAHTHILMSKFILSREHPTCRLKSRRRLLQKRTPLPAHSQEEQQDRVERRPLLELRQAEKDRQQLGRQRWQRRFALQRKHQWWSELIPRKKFSDNYEDEEDHFTKINT